MYLLTKKLSFDILQLSQLIGYGEIDYSRFGVWTDKYLCWADVKYDRTGVFNLNFLFLFVRK